MLSQFCTFALPWTITTEDSGMEDSFPRWIPSKRTPIVHILQGFGHTRAVSSLGFIKPQVSLSMCSTLKHAYFKARKKGCMVFKYLWS